MVAGCGGDPYPDKAAAARLLKTRRSPSPSSVAQTRAMRHCQGGEAAPPLGPRHHEEGSGSTNLGDQGSAARPFHHGTVDHDAPTDTNVLNATQRS